MDLHAGKRAGGWIAALRKGSGPATRDIAGSGDDDVQFCKRIGCSGRLKHSRNEFLERPKASSPSSHSSVTNVKKPLGESWKKLSSKSGTSSSNSCSVSDESEIQELNTSASSRAKLKSKSRDTKSNKGVLTTASRTVEVESSRTKTRKVYGPKGAEIGLLDSGRRRNTVKKRSTEGETKSSARGKEISGPSSEEEHLTNWTPCRGSGVSSVRTRRSVNLRGNNPSRVQSTCLIPCMQQTESCLLSAETSSSGSTLNVGCPSSDASSSMIPVASQDQFVSHIPDRHRSGRYNVDTIANVLLALERIDQDEGLTYEHILSLEVNSVLGGFNFYDHHRGMRLDIDNMSYEELLALEEKMGIVSTALSEEELVKCLRISIYQPLHMKESRMRNGWCLDDTKCSICQEEFIAGDEVGRLGCDHGYHAVCINQWLQLKNWCPICKVSAKPSDSS